MVVQQPFHSVGIGSEKILPENDLNPAVRYMLLWTCTPDWFCDQTRRETHAESPCNELRKRKKEKWNREWKKWIDNGGNKVCFNTAGVVVRTSSLPSLELFSLSSLSLSLLSLSLPSLELFSLSSLSLSSLSLFPLSNYSLSHSLLFELEWRGMNQDFDHSLKSAGHRTHTVGKWMWKGKDRLWKNRERQTVRERERDESAVLFCLFTHLFPVVDESCFRIFHFLSFIRVLVVLSFSYAVVSLSSVLSFSFFLSLSSSSFWILFVKGEATNQDQNESVSLTCYYQSPVTHHWSHFILVKLRLYTYIWTKQNECPCFEDWWSFPFSLWISFLVFCFPCLSCASLPFLFLDPVRPFFSWYIHSPLVHACVIVRSGCWTNQGTRRRTSKEYKDRNEWFKASKARRVQSRGWKEKEDHCSKERTRTAILFPSLSLSFLSLSDPVHKRRDLYYLSTSGTWSLYSGCGTNWFHVLSSHVYNVYLPCLCLWITFWVEKDKKSCFVKSDRWRRTRCLSVNWWGWRFHSLLRQVLNTKISSKF